MSLTLEQVRRIAHLARIEVSATEAEATVGHLNGIFQLIEAMQAVDTRGVEPMAHAQDLAQRLREDAVSKLTSGWPFKPLPLKSKRAFTWFPGS